MLVIRLARTGRNKYPTYRIVAAESARAATGRFIAVLGNYNPHTKELSLKTEDIKKHMSNGAQPSNSVVKLLMREKVELPAWVKLKTKAAKVAPGAETPATEADTEVTESEAAAEADATEEAPEVRVASVIEDEVVATADDAVVNISDTETESSNERQTAATEHAQDAAAEAAKPKA